MVIRIFLQLDIAAHAHDGAAADADGHAAVLVIQTAADLGKIAIDYGYYRYKYLVMLVAVVLLILLVQLFQTISTWLSKKCDKRLK